MKYFNNKMKETVLLSGLSYFLLIMGCVQASPISIDGDLSDWSPSDRLEIPPKSPINAPVTGFELYGRYEKITPMASTYSYKIALHRENGSIGFQTTFWLDTDQNSSTGFLIWGLAGGIEYRVEIGLDGKPYLYATTNSSLITPLQHSIVSDGAGGTNLEIDIPENLIGNPTEEVHLFVDVNEYNTSFLPTNYIPASNSYTISKASGIKIDCDFSDWTPNDLLGSIEAEWGSSYLLYGRYENNNYKMALRGYIGFNGVYPVGGGIGENTTFWLNTDQDPTTGHLIWGFAGGSEYNINITDSSGTAHVYTGNAGETLASPQALSSCMVNAQYFGSLLEVEIPETAIGTPTSSGINLLADVSDSIFLPTNYLPHTNSYTLYRDASPASGKIKIDGAKSDWKQSDRLDLGSNNAVNGIELYGHYEDSKYKILLHNLTETIGQNTTIWLNTDQQITTGHQIWGFAGGAEYNINIDANGIPVLYLGDAGQVYVSDSLNYVITSDGSNGSILELEIPESFIGTPSSGGINLLLDINDNTFMPSSYLLASNQYVLPK